MLPETTGAAPCHHNIGGSSPATAATGSRVASPVVVVGAGPVGLSLAILLARFGVACTVLECSHEPSHCPKARGVRVRTMDLFHTKMTLQPGQRDLLAPSGATF